MSLSRRARVFAANLATAIPFLICDVANAETFVVGPFPSAPYTRIQDAIDASSPGDTVLVKAGYYPENLDFLGKSIVLRSESGADGTIIDGRYADDSVILVVNGEDDRTTVEGFTITGGRGHLEPDKFGGGMFVLNSNCTIRNNIISLNETRPPINPTELGWGAGIFCGGSQGGVVIVEGNRFDRNSAGRNGGAIAISLKMRAVIRDNLIVDNSCSFGDGGGIWVLTTVGETLIERNTIINNRAGDHGGGAYIASTVAGTAFDFVLRSNVFSDNRATSRSITPDAGGGCWISLMNGSVTSNTFLRNLSVSGSPADGSGLAIKRESNVSVQFNLFVLNAPGAALFCESTVLPDLKNNLFWGNLPDHVIGSPCSDQVISDNLFEDPQFCDSLGTNFSLAESSPALNYPAGPLGAVTTPGCKGTAIATVTWSQVKAMYYTSGLRLRPGAYAVNTIRPPILIAR